MTGFEETASLTRNKVNRRLMCSLMHTASMQINALDPCSYQHSCSFLSFPFSEITFPHFHPLLPLPPFLCSFFPPFLSPPSPFSLPLLSLSPFPPLRVHGPSCEKVDSCQSMERPHALGLNGCGCLLAGGTGSKSGTLFTAGIMGGVTKTQGRRGV